MVDRFLGQAEVTARAPTNLHDHKCQWWPSIDADEVQLGSPNVDVAAEHRPSRGGEVPSHKVFGGRPKTLGWSPARRLCGTFHLESIGVTDARWLTRLGGDRLGDAGVALVLRGLPPLA